MRHAPDSVCAADMIKLLQKICFLTIKKAAASQNMAVASFVSYSLIIYLKIYCCPAPDEDCPDADDSPVPEDSPDADDSSLSVYGITRLLFFDHVVSG